MRVGNALGQQRFYKAKKVARCGMFLAVCLTACNGLVAVLIRNIWGSVFSSDEIVQQFVADTLPFFGVFAFLDGYQCVSSGVLRGNLLWTYKELL